MATASDFAVCHQLAEKGVAKIAGGLLQGFMEGRGGGGCIRAMQMEGQVIGGGQLAYKGCVFVGGFPDAVVHVHHGKCDAQLRPLLEQAPEQSHGVGAPGDRYGDPLSGTKEIGSAE